MRHWYYYLTCSQCGKTIPMAHVRVEEVVILTGYCPVCKLKITARYEKEER